MPRNAKNGIEPGGMCLLAWSRWGSLVLIGVVSAIAAYPVVADELSRHHGFRLDGKHLLLLEQRHREIKIGIATRSRSTGNTTQTQTRDESSEAVGRLGTVDYLARISAEVLEPSAPNYLRNPGRRYRIELEGLSVAPDYSARIETDAIVARAAVLAEFDKLASRAHGIQREALHHAGPYVLRILNETNLMPAPITTSIQESQVGRIRFGNPALQRESIEAGRKLYAGEKSKPTTLSPLASSNARADGAEGRPKQRQPIGASRGGTN